MPGGPGARPSRPTMERWPSSATSSPGTSCSRPGGSTSGWSCRPCRTAAGRARWRSRTACTRTWSRRSSAPGVERLWSHQAEALEAAWAGPTIVTTGTASGKSLCFNLPTLDVLSRDARARALYLYPGQGARAGPVRGRCTRSGVKNARPAIYDGDTPREQRSAIRRRSNLVLTNPDMLHLGILPNHGAWGDFFANLAVVVVDEAHVYRGVFGSHVANVLRRLRRVAAAYGTEPRFLAASATIANPGELAERLTGLERRSR